MGNKVTSHIFLLSVFSLIVLCGQPCRADVELNPMFTEAMVLQRGMAVPIYGTGAEGERVVVSIAGARREALCESGRWRVDLPAMKAGGPHTLTVEGNNRIALKNVLIGDIWILAGQSNMARLLKQFSTLEARLPELPENDRIRFFKIKQGGVAKDEPSGEVLIDPFFANSWRPCSRRYIAEMSATGYFFALNRYEMNQVPIGLVYATRGATRAASWTPMATLLSDPLYKDILDPQSNSDYKANSGNPDAIRRPSALYNGTIHPLQPFGIKGVLWYQGESDSKYYKTYRTLFPAMIRSWRENWGQGDFHFIYAQISSHQDRSWNTSESPCTAWAWAREAQACGLREPKTAMVATHDAGEWEDIHPQDKETVGKRLALAAAKLNGEKVIASGPVYREIELQEGRALLRFDHAEGGLVSQTVRMNKNRDMAPGADKEAFVSPAERVTGFSICGTDRVFHDAEARIVGDTVIVISPAVAKPVAVRYAWKTFTLANLYNRAGLPAFPFRTDDFPMPDVFTKK